MSAEPIPDRYCPFCGKQLVRGEFEPINNWKRRRSCGTMCAAQLAKRNKARLAKMTQARQDIVSGKRGWETDPIKIEQRINEIRLEKMEAAAEQGSRESTYVPRIYKFRG